MRGVILIDGGHYRAIWKQQHAPLSSDGDNRLDHVPMASSLTAFIEKTQAEVSNEVGGRVRWIRSYYYDTEPFGDTKERPDGVSVDFSADHRFKHMKQLLDGLRGNNWIAVRLGELRFRGWQNAAGRKPAPEFSQKGVDMKIGLDIAWIATKRIADIIVLVAGDTDFIPAMKLARTEGVVVGIIDIKGTGRLTRALCEHADLVLSLRTQA